MKFPFFKQRILGEKNHLSEARKALDVEIDTLFEMDNHEGLLVLIDEGVKFNKSQIDQIFLKHENQLIYSIKGETFQKFNKNNQEVILESLSDAIEEGMSLMEKNKFINKEYTTVQLETKNFAKVVKFHNAVNFFGSEYGQCIFKKDFSYANRIYQASLRFKKYMSSLEEKHGTPYLSANLKKFSNSVHKELVDKSLVIYNEVNKERLVNMAKKANTIELNEVKASLITSLTAQVNSFDIASLPVECQNLFMKIGEASRGIKVEDLAIEEKLQFDNLTEKRLPQVIQQYIIVADKNKGGKSSANHLLEECLAEILDKLTALHDDSHDQKIDAMKKTKNYLKYM